MIEDFFRNAKNEIREKQPQIRWFLPIKVETSHLIANGMLGGFHFLREKPPMGGFHRGVSTRQTCWSIRYKPMLREINSITEQVDD